MKFSVERRDLLTALATLVKVVPSRPTHPILGYLLVSLENETLTLSAYDLHKALTLTVDTAFGEQIDGIGVIPANLLFQAVKAQPELTLDFNLVDQVLTLNTILGSSELKCADPDEYPALPTVDSAGLHRFQVAQLTETLQRVAYAASNESAKQILCGVHLLSDGETVESACTDGHRLATNAVTPIDTTDGLKHTIPVETVGIWLDILKTCNPEQQVQVQVNDTSSELTTAYATIVSRNYDGTYPAYQTLIPQEFELEININTSEFKQALIGCSPFTALNLVTLHFKDDQVLVWASAQDVGECEQKVQLENTVESELKIRFNVNYLLDALKVIKGKLTTLNFNTPSAPVVIHDFDYLIKDEAHLIMPVKIQD